MADYYPLITRAVASLPQNTDEARRALYDRARNALVAQLRSNNPPLSESEISHERRLFEEAIRKVETEAFGNQKRHEQKQSEQTQLGPNNHAPPAEPTTPGKMSDKLGKLFFSYSGRISRATFWLAFLCLLPVHLIVVFRILGCRTRFTRLASL